MKFLVILLALTVLQSCAFRSLLWWRDNPPLPGYYNNIHEENACLPQSIVVQKHLEKRDVWAKVISYYYNVERSAGHAICVFEYGGRLWTYDHSGSYSIKSRDKEDALMIAQQAEIRRSSGRTAVSAKFLD